MATTKVCLQEESILKLVLEFLTARKYYKSARSLEKETGVLANPLSESLSFFRDLVLDGDWPAVREFGEPLADIPAFEYRRFNFLVAKQEYLEILFEKCEGNIKDEQALRDRLLTCLQNLEKYCKFKDAYNKLYWYLSVPSLRSEPEFCNWSVDSSRMELFEEMLDLLKQFIPVGEQYFSKNNLASEDRLLSLLFKGSLYENCIEFCQKQAMGKTAATDYSLTKVRVDLFRKQSLKSAANFYSWLHSLSKESFVVPFEELKFDLQVEKQRQSRVNFDVKNNSLTRSLTIEVKSPSKLSPMRGRDERRKRFSDFPQSKPTVLDFDVRDVSQSFAEFEFAENENRGLSKDRSPLILNDQDVFFRNGEIWPEATSGHTSNVSPKAAQSPRKVRQDQQNLVLLQLEEHKQRQQELYKQLAESASIARESGMIKDTRQHDVIPEESSATKSLEAVKKSIQNLKLLTENYESPKVSQADEVFTQDDSNTLNVAENRNNQRLSSHTRPSTINIPNEMQSRKSSSSTPGSAALPKTPVNTCLPPGFVKLTDGSGAFNTSTPKAERQSFTTPLPASPVPTEQRFSKDDTVFGQSKQQQGSHTHQANIPSDVNVQTPKAATSGARQFTGKVRRSLVNTVFQNENATSQTDETKEQVGSDRNDARSQMSTASAMRNDRMDARSKNQDGKADSQFPITAGTNPKNSSSSNCSMPKNPNSTRDIRSSGDVPKDPRLQDISSIKNTLSTISSQPCLVTTVNNRERTFPSTNSAPLNFQKSAMLADTQAIRAVVFHPSGNYFAVGTNSKALMICRMRNKNDYRLNERSEQDTPELEVLCQKSSIHKGSVYCVAFSSNGEIIATGSNDKTIKILRFNADNPLNMEDQMDLSIHNATVRDLTFVNTAAGSQSLLASGGAGGGLIYLSDCFTGQTVSSLQGHAGNIMAVFASNQAHLLCSGSADKTVRLWDLRMAKCIDVIATSSCVTSLCFNYGTTHSLLLASADDNGQCIVYDVGARKSITSFNPHEMDCRSIRFSPDSKYILTGSYDACVAITAVQYNSSEMLSDSRIVARHRDKVIQCRWHPSEYSFLSTSADKTVVLWQQTMR